MVSARASKAPRKGGGDAARSSLARPAVVVVVAGTTSIGAVSGTSKDPTSLIDRRNAVWNKGDTSAVASLYAPNAVLTFLDSSTYVGRAAITEQIKESYRCKNHTKRVAPVSVHGDDAATFIRTARRAGVVPVHGKYFSVCQIHAGKVVLECTFCPCTQVHSTRRRLKRSMGDSPAATGTRR